MRSWLKLKDTKTDKEFIKYFTSPYERDKFRRKLYYSSKLIILGSDGSYEDN